MPSRPIGNLPSFATDDLYTSGPDFGLATKLEPLTGEKAQGYQRDQRPPARKFNWILNKVSAWVSHLANLAVYNWHNPILYDATNTLLDGSYTRADGTNEIFFWPARLQWIALGRNTNGAFYLGSDGLMNPKSTTFALKYSFGLALGDKALVFNSDSTATPNGPKYAVSASLDPNTWTAGVLPGGPFTAVSTANDAVAILAGPHAGRIVVVGGGQIGGSNKLVAWYSDDQGATWAAPVPVITSSIFGGTLVRVVCGTTNRLIAFVHASSVNQGSVLFYSDDGGATWTQSPTVPFQNALDACYVPDAQLWAFCSGNVVYVSTDPIGGSFSSFDFGFPVKALAASDGVLMVATQTGPSNTLGYVFVSTDSGQSFQLISNNAIVGATGLNITGLGSSAAAGFPGSYAIITAAGVQISLQAR